MPADVWQRPWIRSDRVLCTLISDRLERDPNETADRALARALSEQRAIERIGWFD